MSQAPVSASGLVRVTVASGTRRVDLVLPGAVPVAELVPELARSVGLLDPSTVYGGYRLVPGFKLPPMMFAPEEALFPWPARSFSGFRLLSEYFAAREKFHFIDICRLDAKTLVSAGNKMDIFVYLDRAMPDLEDVAAMALPVLSHRVVLNFQAEAEGVSAGSLIAPLAKMPRFSATWLSARRSLSASRYTV